MKITKRQLRRIIKEEKALIEAYNSMSPRSKSLANAAKRQFAKDYPDVQVGIDGREGWLTVNGKKAVNMSQASGSPLSMDDIIDQMKQAYLGHPMSPQEVPEASPGSRPGEHKLDFGKDIGTYNYRSEGANMKITKRQLRRIIKEVVNEAKKPPTDETIKPHMSQYQTSDDPYEVAEEIGKEYGWNQKQIETAESLIRKRYIR